jgi:hypothetical protein
MIIQMNATVCAVADHGEDVSRRSLAEASTGWVQEGWASKVTRRNKNFEEVAETLVLRQ